jgi:PPM family protein phosphatase
MKRPPLPPGAPLGREFCVVRPLRGTARRWLYEVTDARPERATRTCWSCRFDAAPREEPACPRCGGPLADRSFLASVRWSTSPAWRRLVSSGGAAGLEAPLVVFDEANVQVSVTPWREGWPPRLLLDEPAPLPTPAVLGAARSLGAALEALAERGFAVRDLGADNVLLEGDGAVLFDPDVTAADGPIDVATPLELLWSYLGPSGGRVLTGAAPTQPEAVAAITDTGLVRRRNEDAWLWDRPAPQVWLYAVADGLGGLAAGEVASRKALAALRDAIGAQLADGAEPGGGVLVEGFAAAHRAVSAHRRDHSLEKMGTTLVTALVVGGTAHLGHVGDSRAYLLRAGALEGLTEDHSLVRSLVRKGLVTRDAARRHGLANVLERAVGMDPVGDPDLREVAVEPGDRLLLCSDGVWNELDEDELALILGATDPREVCRDLLAAVHRRGARDNLTAIVVDIPR